MRPEDSNPRPTASVDRLIRTRLSTPDLERSRSASTTFHHGTSQWVRNLYPRSDPSSAAPKHAGPLAARTGAPVSAIGAAVEGSVLRRGYNVIPQLGEHGIGRTIHEAPSVPNFRDPHNHHRLTRGLVLTSRADHRRRCRAHWPDKTRRLDAANARRRPLSTRRAHRRRDGRRASCAHAPLGGLRPANCSHVAREEQTSLDLISLFEVESPSQSQ